MALLQQALRRGQPGHIPPGIGLLTNLTTLTITNTKGPTLTGSIPTEISNLTKLNVLDLRGNKLTNAIPTQVGDLTTLTYLNLSDNNFTGGIPASILSANLNRVTYLDLSKNNLTGQIPNPTGVMTALRELNLSANNLSGPLPARFLVGTNATNHAFSGLTNIDLSHNPLNVAGGTVLQSANTTLQYLNLSYCGLTGGVPDYSPNSALIYLDISHNNLTGAINTGPLFKLPQLRYIYIGYNNFTAGPFQFGNGNSAGIPLEVFSAPATNMTAFCTPRIPTDLQRTLREIDISNNNILHTSATNGLPPQGDLNLCTNLEKLDFSNNRIETMRTITTLTKLKYYNVSGNNIPSTVLTTGYFTANTNLEEIYINNNNLSRDIT